MENNEQNTAFPDGFAASAMERARILIRILYEKMAKEIKWIAASSSEITDYYVVATGRSATHVKALADELEYEAGRRGFSPLHTEGKDGGVWLLLDFGDVIVHVFSKEAREFYRFERLFREEDFLDVTALTQDEQQTIPAIKKGRI